MTTISTRLPLSHTGTQRSPVRRLLALACCLIAAAPLATSASSPQSGITASYLLNEDFNAESLGKAPSTWTVDGPAGAVTIQAPVFAADLSLQLQKGQGARAIGALHAFTPTTGKVVAEAKIRVEEQQGSSHPLIVSDRTNQPAVDLLVRDGTLYTHSNNDETKVQSIQPGIWYILRLEMNTNTRCYDLYVDGIKKVTAAVFRNNVSSLSAVGCSIDGDHPGTLLVDNVMVYSHAGLIGEPPKPIYDVFRYGATGNGTTKDTEAIQKAIDACAESGGSVYLHDGIFVAGSLRLKSKMTLFIDSSATLFGSPDDADYPEQPYSAGKFKYKRALVYIPEANNVRIDGGGTIDGNGRIKRWVVNNNEEKRSFLIHSLNSNYLTVQNVYLKDATMWCFVPAQTDNILIRNINIDSRAFGNRDGIDLVDTQHVLVENCTINTDDDSICPKSTTPRGLDDVTVRKCYLVGSVRANGIKFGTASVGGFKNGSFQDILIKNCDKSALALESVDGADVSNIVFRRIDLNATNSPFYLTIGRRGDRGMTSPKIGSIENILFEDVVGNNLKRSIGCPISGLVHNGTEYRLKNITFRRCKITFQGGETEVPGMPPEAGREYPECNNWHNLPAFGYFIRHADHIRFENCVTKATANDSRPWRVLEDVNDLKDE
ncbi:MAG: glycoside hydrolase family 28 protein [Chthoniobacteraceae bacterium]